MKKFIKLKLIILTLFFAQTLAFASFNDILVVDIQYDWINKSEVEKEAIIEEIHDIIFENGALTKKEDFKSQFKDKLKDKNYKNQIRSQRALEEIEKIKKIIEE